LERPDVPSLVANVDVSGMPRIRNKALLGAIFALKGNWSPGIRPEPRAFDGIEIAPFRNDARAAACISADLELSWAFRRHPTETAREKARQTRENIPYLLRIFEDHAFPITWATVGHLFLDSCERNFEGVAHPDMPRPPRNDMWRGDWYVHDPGTHYKEDPYWYAPDVIERILDSPVGHELGTHSFSHIDFSPSCSDPALVRREIEASATAMRRFGITPRSLVYPFNRMGHAYLDLLSEFAITSVRHRDQCVTLSYPERTPSGVYKLYESMHLRRPTRYDYLDKVELFMAKAVERRAVFHLWFHPSDPPSLFETELLGTLKYIDRQRHQTLVWIATMRDIASYCEARERLRPHVERNGAEMTVVWRGSFPSQRYGNTELSLIFPALPTPRKLILTAEGGSRHLEPEHSSLRTTQGRLMINMPTTATSLRLLF
jgi:peptidoglycan/xylan/chitin deacetylase (PgdA/CDA1 family)